MQPQTSLKTEMTRAIHHEQTFISSPVGSNHFVWSIAIILSLLVHFALFIPHNKPYNAQPDMLIQKTITHVNFAHITPPPMTIAQPQVEKIIAKPIIPPVTVKPIEEKTAEKKPEAILKKKAKPRTQKIPKPKPKPKVNSKVQPKPEIKLKKMQPTVKKRQTETMANIADTHNKLKTSPLKSQADKRLLEQTRKTYKALLMRHIEVHKHYPRVARKRKIEGKILISFSLLDTGQIKDLLINGKRSILKKATANAIDAALPMPQPPKSLAAPLQIKFYMNYYLK